MLNNLLTECKRLNDKLEDIHHKINDEFVSELKKNKYFSKILFDGTFIDNNYVSLVCYINNIPKELLDILSYFDNDRTELQLRIDDSLLEFIGIRSNIITINFPFGLINTMINDFGLDKNIIKSAINDEIKKLLLRQKDISDVIYQLKHLINKG